MISARGSRRSGKRQKANGGFTPAQRAMIAGWWPEFGASPALEATTADHAVLDAEEFIGTTRHRRGDWESRAFWGRLRREWHRVRRPAETGVPAAEVVGELVVEGPGCGPAAASGRCGVSSASAASWPCAWRSRSKTSESSKLICRAAVGFTKPWLRMRKTIGSYVPSATTRLTSPLSRRDVVKPRWRLRARVHIGERSKKTVAPPPARTESCRCLCRVMTLLIKSWSCHGSARPRARPRAMTSVAASSTTGYPLASSSRRTAVFPAPGAPEKPSLHSSLSG